MEDLDPSEIWNHTIEQYQKYDGITESEKEDFCVAWFWLRNELGEDFLLYACLEEHPFRRRFLGTSQIHFLWLMWFINSLKTIKAQDNRYADLLKKIKLKHRHNEALSFLETIHVFSRAGFNIQMEPSLMINGKQREADLKIIDEESRDEIFIEVTALGDCKGIGDTDTYIDAIWPTEKSMELLTLSMDYRLKLLEMPAENIVKKIIDQAVEKIDKAIIEANETGSLQEVIIDGYVEFAVAPKAGIPRLNEWARKRNMGDDILISPDIPVNEFQRIKDKILKEIQQLPFDYQSMVIIRVETGFFAMQYSMEFMDAIEQGLFKYKSLLAVTFMEGNIGIGNSQIVERENHLTIQKDAGGRCNIILNPECIQLITHNTKQKILQAFRDI